MFKVIGGMRDVSHVQDDGRGVSHVQGDGRGASVMLMVMGEGERRQPCSRGQASVVFKLIGEGCVRLHPCSR